MVRLSHSSVDIFQKCKRWYYLAKIKKVPVIADDRHMRRGSCFHDCAEWINKNSDTTGLKDFFEATWEKYKLSRDFQQEHDATYLMVLEFLKNKPEVTSTEFEIYRSMPIHFVSYLDSINTHQKVINDYKTSTLGYEVEPYKDQMRRYSMMYRFKFGHKPEKCIVWFVKYSPVRKIEYIFEDADLDACEQEIREIDAFIEQNTAKGEGAFEKCNGNCHVFCPYTNICAVTASIDYKIEIYGNKIKLIGVVDDIMNKALIKKFSYELKDAYFIKKRYPMANTRINFWNNVNQTLPIGFLEGLKKTLNDYAEYYKKPLELEEIDCRKVSNGHITMPESFINGKKLRDYQEEAVNVFLEKKIGILQIGTGGGKTLIATEAIRRLGYKTLFVVNKIELLLQTKKVLEDALGIPIGIIGRGEDKIEDITVATIQTLMKHLPKYKNYLQDIRFVICDECHNIASASYQRLSNYLINTDFRLGMSGTAYRDDKADLAMNAVCGDVIYNATAESLINENYLMHPKVVFVKDYITPDEAAIIRTSTIGNLIEETKKYPIYYEKFIAKNQHRNNLVLSLVKRHTNDKILIITRLVEHGIMLTNMIPGSKHIHGETSKNERVEIMKEFKEGNLNFLVSNISIWGEGVDAEKLRVIINTAANRGSVRTTQLIGRIMRILENKKQPIYYDFLDSEKFFYQATNARKKILREQGYEITYLEAQNI